MDWKHELAFRQRPGFTDYRLPSHVEVASLAIVVPAPTVADAGKLLSDHAGKFVYDTFFNLGIADYEILAASAFRIPKPEKIVEGFFTTTKPKPPKGQPLTQDWLNPIVGPTPLAPPSRLVMAQYCKREYEGEIFRLVQTLDYWSLPIFAMGKVSQWAIRTAVPTFTDYRGDNIENIATPFIVDAPLPSAALSKKAIRKRFEDAAEDFAEKVKKWRSANSSSPTRKVPAAANRAAEVLVRARTKAKKKK